MTAPAAARPRLGVFKLASCDGCQLQLLDAGVLDELGGRVEIVHFPEATGAGGGPLDLALIEGSVSTPEHLDEVRAIRARAATVVTIGACATAGGIQALRNALDEGELRAAAYPDPATVRSLPTSTAVADHVAVDLELHGCPVDRGQLVAALGALLAGGRPDVTGAPVCGECKRRGVACVVVTAGEPCLGPVTRAGCGAICPAYGRGCYGCFGPSAAPATVAFTRALRERHGLAPAEIARRFRVVTSNAPAFRDAAGEVVA